MMINQKSSAAIISISQLVRDKGTLSRAEIAHCLHMSPATVGRMVENLINKNVLSEIGQIHGNGYGRPSIMLRFNSTLRSVLTVDLRLTEAYAAITDLDGNVILHRSCPLTTNNMKASVEELISMLREMLSTSILMPPVEVIVIGAPSTVDVESGMIDWAPSLGWAKLPLKQILEEEFAKTVLVENDVNLGLIGEYWKGAGNLTFNNIIFVSIGTGIGAGIYINGELYRGSTFAAGEVAYFLTDINAMHNNAGQMGKLENRVGQEGLVRIAQLVALRYPTSPLAELLRAKSNKVNPQEILDLVEQGDPGARIVYNELVDALSIVICNIAVVLDPELIILGSPGIVDCSNLIPSILDRIGDAFLRPIRLVPSKLGRDALIIGGAYYALPVLKVFKSVR